MSSLLEIEMRAVQNTSIIVANQMAFRLNCWTLEVHFEQVDLTMVTFSGSFEEKG